MEYDLDHSIQMIKVVVILHQICIVVGENPDADWDVPYVIYKRPSSNTQTIDGNDIHDALTDYFLRNSI